VGETLIRKEAELPNNQTDARIAEDETKYRRLFRINAARYMARFVYGWPLLAVQVGVVVLVVLAFWLPEGPARAPFVLIFIAALYMGWLVSFLVRDFYFSYRLLKRSSPESLRREWLRLGGFDPEMEKG
jgi:hypothetical protein